MSAPESSLSAILLALWKPTKMPPHMCEGFCGADGELFYKEMSNGELLVISQKPGEVYLEIYADNNDEALSNCWIVDICTGKFTQILGADPVVTKFVVPSHSEDPAMGMIDFLHENPMKWEGDESGLIFYGADDQVTYHAFPGDTVYRDQAGVYRVEKRQ